MSKNRIDKCSTEMNEKYRLTPEQYSVLVTEMREIVEESLLPDADLNKIIEHAMTKKTELIKQSERQRLLNKEAFVKLDKYIQQEGFKGDTVAGIKSLLVPIAKYRYDGMGSVWTAKKQYQDRLQTILDQAVYKHKAQKHMNSGEYDKAIMRAVETGTFTKDDPVVVRDIAIAVRKLQDIAYAEKKKAGVELGYLDNYLMKTTHPAEAMSDYGREAWTRLAYETFDFERMGLVTPDAVDKYLDDFFTKRVRELSELRGSKINTQDFKQIQTNAFADRMARSRKVHFKTPEDHYRYFKELNPNDTIYGRLITEIDRDAAQIAAMKMFGPNFKMVFKSLLEKAKGMEAAKGKEQRIKFDQNHKFLESTFKGLTQGEFQGRKNWIAHTGEIARALTNMAKLGNALVTTVTDFAFGAGNISSLTGRNYFGELAYMMKETFANFVSPAHRRAVAAEISSFANDVNGSTMNTRFGEYGKAHDWFSKTHQLYMRLTGLSNQAVSAKLATAKRLAKYLADDSKLEFSQLPKGNQSGLSKFGIGKAEWKMIRNASDEGLITPDTIMDLPDTFFPGMKPEQAMDLKIELGSKLQQYLTHYAERGSPTTSGFDFALKNLYDRNDYRGQALQLMLQYKSFALASWDTMQTIAKTGAEDSMNTRILGYTIATGSAFGAVAITMRDILSGRDPEIFNLEENNIKGWMKFAVKSFVQSGCGGLMVDFLFDDYEKSWVTLPGKLAGPAIGGIGQDFVSLLSATMDIDNWKDEEGRTKLIRKTFMALEKNSPSIPFTRAVIIRNVFDAMHRTLNTQRKPRKGNNFDFGWGE